MSCKYDIDPECAGCFIHRCPVCGERYHVTDEHECFEPDDYTPPLEYKLDEPGRGTL